MPPCAVDRSHRLNNDITRWHPGKLSCAGRPEPLTLMALCVKAAAVALW